MKKYIMKEEQLFIKITVDKQKKNVILTMQVIILSYYR